MFRFICSPLQIHQETFGKSGCRRIVPGQYLAVDPKGRAIMIGIVYLFIMMHRLINNYSPNKVEVNSGGFLLSHKAAAR